MEKYRFSDTEAKIIESSCIPYAVYQFIDSRVVTVALSDGFCELFHLPDRESARRIMDTNMYHDVHRGDVARIADAAVRFAREEAPYSVVYRSKNNDQYHIIHSIGKHILTEDGTRLAYVWYTDEGPCDGEGEDWFKSAIRHNFETSELGFSGSYDHLTGLPEINYFFKLTEARRDRFLSEGRMPVMLYFDFNGMKNYNIRHGFTEGDNLIIGMAKLLADHFGNESCCRFGGDHFAVCTEEKGIDEKLTQIFEECKSLNGGNSLPVRAGIYSHRMGECSVGTVCDRAKMACDTNRESTKSVYAWFTQNLLQESERRQYVIDHLDQALREHWIQVYYQPIIRAANGRVCDEEALARWIDPVRGMLRPDQFISVLEDARLIYKLDLYITEQILIKMKRQAEAGLFVVPCSVNISRTDFETCDIVEEIRKRVDAAGIEHDKLTVEITESVIGSDLDYMVKRVDRFHELGFKVWMDDYGSGYSSPDILQNIPFDTIKLDMLFLRQFESNQSCRIIISGLIRMAAGLGIETVVEGIETEEQAEFLKEIGCTKLQGYYYCKPIPADEVFARYERGAQIGFEDPAEAEYYSTIGRVNMYDISLTAMEEDRSHDYFNTMPMVIVALEESRLSLIRCNKSYRTFIQTNFEVPQINAWMHLNAREGETGDALIKAIVQCGSDGRQIIIDERSSKGKIVHLFIRRIAVNPVTGVKALAIVVLGISDESVLDTGLTYGRIAEALSADYINLYYVRLDNEHFIEYSPDAALGNMTASRRGKDFFETARRDAMDYLYEEDRKNFVNAFTKDNVLRAIDDHGSFTFTYRLLVENVPTYVHMKAIYIGSDKKRLVIGVSNIDAQKKQQETLERVKEERITYSRITALAGDYLSFYTVDPETDRYVVYSATRDYDDLGTSKSGSNFYEAAVRESKDLIYYEDFPVFEKEFTKENILKKIEEDGIFVLNYRLTLNGEPRYVNLKMVMVTEEGKQRLIVGVSDIDAQIKRDQEYVHNLAAARNKVNIDPLTGLKNKHAYIDMENQINGMISERKAPPFALIVCDINSLKQVNNMKGQKEGDEYLKEGAMIICKIFRHSPVFRVGGDEFAVISRGQDYERIDELMKELREKNIENIKTGAPVVAGGMARYHGEVNVEDLYRKADVAMYEDKAELKLLH